MIKIYTDFEKFRNYLISCGFHDAVKDKIQLKIGENEFNLTHCPVDAKKETIYNRKYCKRGKKKIF